MNDQWSQTQPDMLRPIGEYPIDDTEVLEAVHDGRHRRISRVPRGAIGLMAGIVIGGAISTAAYLTAPESNNTPNIITTVMPTVTATRPGHTVRLPGQTVTRRLRVPVTVRATRTLPRSTVTVTATPTGLTATGTP